MGTASNPAPDPASDPADTYRRVIDAVGAGDAAALDELMATDLVDHNPVPGQAPGVEGFRQWMAAARAAFPDLRGTVDAVVADGDLAAGRVTWRGTHRGPFVGLPASGREVTILAFHHVRVSSGRVVEWWGTADLLGAVQQLGGRVVPGGPAATPPGPGAGRRAPR
jgi:steroid delta-isomerase-like uncharacterized protein